MNRNVEIVHGIDGNKIVVIYDIRFKGKRKIDWDDVKDYLKEYVGEFYQIVDTKDIINIKKEPSNPLSLLHTVKNPVPCRE